MKPTFKVKEKHACESMTAHGRPCTVGALYNIRGKWYCGFHHPDKSKRRESGSAATLRTYGVPPSKAPRKESKFSTRLTKMEPTGDPAADFANSLRELVKEGVRSTLSELLSK